MDLSKRVAVITGGGSSIGRAVAAAIAPRGVTAVALVDVSEGIENVAEKLNAEAGRTFAIPFHGNTTDEKFRASVFDEISGKYGRVSLCVPAAGITRDDLAVRIDKMTGKARIYPLEQFKLVVDVNLIAPVYWALEMIGRTAEDRAAKGLKRWTPDEGMQGSVVFKKTLTQGGRVELDAQYFLDLSDDAVPALAAAFRNKPMPEVVREKVGAALFGMRYKREQDDRKIPWQASMWRVITPIEFLRRRKTSWMRINWLTLIGL